MAGKALAAFSLLATLLQVQAQFNCYPNGACGGDNSPPMEVSSAMECCLQDLSMPLSYEPTDNSDVCRICYVVGFESETLSLNEDGSDSADGDINLFLLHPTNADFDQLRITFQINEMLSSATFDMDYTLDGFDQRTRTITPLVEDGISLSIGVIDDNTPGEEDNFVLEITSAQVIPDGTVDLVNVFVNNSLTVFIVEDDVLQVEFGRSEYDIDEEMLTQDITFTISNPINEDAYFYVQALTYEEYDDLYPVLNETYQDLPTSTLDQEYDQAELEDFKSRKIPFIIKANTDFIEGTVTIEVVDDNMLEPFSEGFRLVILVNETMTPLSYVGFGTGRQVALFRIDDRQDKFQFGFVNESLRITDREGTRNIPLHLYVAANNATEYTIRITFTDTGSTATRGEDYAAFEGDLRIVPPAMIEPMTFFEVAVSKLDKRFEPEETIVINVGNIELLEIDPYVPRHDTTGTVMSTVIPPDIQTRIIRDLPRTTIIIEAGGILTVYLHVPEVVREGESFTRNVSASDLVQGQFRVFNSPGTAMLQQDYLGGTGRVSFADSTSADGGEVEIISDSLVEPNETFTVSVRLSSPDELEPFLVIENSPQVVTILDSNTATIGFRDVTLSVNESAGVAVLTVAVLGSERLATNAEVRVSFSTMTGTADGQDFGSITDMELVFSGTQQEINVTVAIIHDTEFENLEMFTAHLTLLSSNVRTDVSPSLATVNIIDDDPLILGFDSLTYSASEAQGWVILTVIVTTGVPMDGFEMRLQTIQGSAQGASDFIAVNQVFQLSSTQLTYQFNITIVNDGILELAEAFSASLSRVTQDGNIIINPDMTTVNIADNDGFVLGFSQVAYSGSEGAPVIPVVEVKSGELATSLSVDISFSTSDATATSPDDYTSTSNVLSFTSGVQQLPISIQLIDDDLFEDDEHFFANLALQTTLPNVQLDVNQAQLNIEDTDEITIGFTVDEKYVNESDGAVTLEVSVFSEDTVISETPVTLERNVHISFQTVSSISGHLATSDVDYASGSGTLSFDSSNLARNITISIHHDTALEYDEIFRVNLTTDVSRVTVSPQSATVKIIDDDEVTVGFEQATYEFTEYSVSGSMRVVLTGELERDVAVLVSTSPGTASAGADYTSIMSRELVFNSSLKSLPLTLNIVVDEVVEYNETLSATLTREVSTDRILLNPSSTAITITDDDFVVIGFKPISYKMSESSGQVNLMIRVFSGVLDRDVEIILDTYGHGITGQIDGSAMDIMPISRQIIVFNNTASRIVTVSLTDDLILETDELFFANLSVSPTEKAVMLNNSVADITILNDDMVEIGFDQLLYEINEDDGFVDIHFGIRNNAEIRSTSSVDVEFLALEGAATFTSDFNCGPPTTYTFTSKDTQFTVRCLITNDLISENLESFSLLLHIPSGLPAGVTINPDNIIVEIIDDDNVSFSFAEPLYIAYEGEGEANVTVFKNGISDYPRSITVRGTVQNGVIIEETLVFLAGESLKIVQVPLIDDTTALEPTEQYPLSLQIPSNQVGVELGEINSTILEVVDDDVLRLTLTAPAIVVENVVQFDIFVEANFAVATEVTLNVFTFLNTTEGLAQEGEDYMRLNENVTLAPGQSLTTTITAEIVDDSRLEQLYESYEIRMDIAEQPPFAMIDLVSDQADVRIQDNDALEIGFKDSTYREFERVGYVTFEVEVKNNGMFAVPVDFTVTDTEGQAIRMSDYIGLGSGVSLQLQPGQTSVQYNVTIVNDNVTEVNEETFTLNLNTTQDRVTILAGSDQAPVTIIDDDNVTIGFDEVEYNVNEDTRVTQVCLRIFNGTLADDRNVMVTLVSMDMSATAPSDYESVQMTITLTRNMTSACVDVQIKEDDILEGDEIFDIMLDSSDPSVDLHPDMTQITIVDSDVLRAVFNPRPYMVIENEGPLEVCVDIEGGVLSIPVTLTASSQDGDAVDVEDFIAFSESLLFSAGDTQQCFFITIVNDTSLEETQTFTVTLTSNNPSVQPGNDITVTIIDDDGITVGFINTPYQSNEQDGSQIVTVAVITGQLDSDVTLLLSTTDDTATVADNDYDQITSHMITFSATITSVNVQVVINDDGRLEPTEQLIMHLEEETASQLVTIAVNDVPVTITNDDMVELEFDFPSYVTPEGKDVVTCVDIVQGVLAKDISVTVSGTDGTAMGNGVDYEAFTITLNFTAGDSRKCFNITIIDDPLLETDEHFFVTMTTTEPFVVTGPQSNVTIVDNDGVSVGFQRSQYFYQESDGQAIVTVVLTGDIAVDVVVIVSGGPSTQTNIGPARVEYNDIRVTFAANGPKEQNVSTEITNDNIALEADEIVTVGLTVGSPASGVTVGNFQNTVVTIADNDIVSVQFVEPRVQVNESEGMVEICVEKSLATIEDLILDLTARNGSAFAGSDYNLVVSTVTIPSDQLQECFSVDIVDDSVVEGTENFFVDLGYSGSGTVSVVAPSTIEVIVYDRDVPDGQECILSNSLILQTFSNQMVDGYSFSMAEGCERKLVTTCDENVVDLEIRVDFLQDDFSSTKVAVVYEGETVIIDENLNLSPTTPPISEIFYASGLDTVSVSIPEIKLTITRNLSALTIFTDNTSLPLAGLCGDLNEQLLLPDCNRTVGSTSEADLNAFKASYKLKPSDQILRGERMECGITVNDTVIGDPLLTVPIHTPGYPDDLHLCYEIHGAADQYFNFISDECTSVNAHYAQAPGADFLNIIDSMSFVAVDNQHICRRISVDVANCSASVDGVDLPPMSRKRSISTYEENGISVRAYQTRVRVSVPNCADNSLVMWVFCQKQSFLNPYNESQTIGPIDMIKFEVTRGFNLKETSHGLLGQFWNIPMNVTEYVGLEDYYTVTVFHPSSPPRSFTGYRYDLTWEFEDKLCLYVGNRQGGPIGEVDDPNDSVIEGAYADYITQGPFMTDYIYAVFDAVCN